VGHRKKKKLQGQKGGGGGKRGHEGKRTHKAPCGAKFRKHGDNFLGLEGWIKCYKGVETVKPKRGWCGKGGKVVRTVVVKRGGSHVGKAARDSPHRHTGSG